MKVLTFKKTLRSTTILALASSLILGIGCSSTPPIKSHAYAKLSNQKTFEYEFPVVWKALEETLRNHKIINRDPSDVKPLELKKLTHRTLETDWVYGQSRDKYLEYKVNGYVRKTYLQVRFKYEVEAQTVLGGVTVTVKTDEEIEKLNADGTSDGYSQVKISDPTRPSELLDKLNIAILAAPVI